jgi:hypothetical protein
MPKRHRPRSLFLLLIGISFSFAAVTEAQNFTLEQVMAPVPLRPDRFEARR